MIHGKMTQNSGQEGIKNICISLIDISEKKKGGGGGGGGGMNPLFHINSKNQILRNEGQRIQFQGYSGELLRIENEV